VLRHIESFDAATKKTADPEETASNSSSTAALPPLPYNGSMNEAVKAQV